MAKKRVKAKSKKVVKGRARGMRIAFRNLIGFLILFVLSLVLYNATSDLLLQNLFGLVSVLSGFVALAFLIVVLVFLVLKFVGK